MNNSIKSLIISIMITISIVIVSIPIWNYCSGNSVSIIASSYEKELPIVINVGKFESLLNLADNNDSNIINPTVIELKNRNGYEINKNLYLVVEKNSTIPYNYLVVSINDNIFKINQLEMFEDDNNYYFKIKNVNFKEYEQINLNSKLWINSNTEIIQDNAILIVNFIIE